MTPKLNWFDRLSGRFYWWCLDHLNMSLEDVERSTLYRKDPTIYRRIIDYFYYKEAKMWKND